MPLLPAEPFIFPTNLLDLDNPTDHLQWLVVHSRPRAEKAIARRLHQHSVPFFLPLHEWRRNSAGRILTTFAPLFPGYLFVHAQDEQRTQVFATNGIARVIPVADPSSLISDLRSIYRLMNSGQPLRPEQKFAPGMSVEVISGALRGVVGRVIRSGGQYRLYIEIRILECGVSMEIDEALVRPLPTRVGA